MKTLKIFAILFMGIITFACNDETETPAPTVTIPETFTVDIPDELSNQSSGGINGRTSGECADFVEGDEIYESLRGFIWVGEEAAEIAEFTLLIASALEAKNVTSLNFISEEDGREKRLEITRDVMRGGVTYDNELTMFDVEDNGQALQLLWNVDPIQGVAILNPYNIDRATNPNPDAFLRIDYSEIDPNYDATMTVSISGLDPVEKEISTMKLFVGRKGDVVEVKGNSDHPEIKIIDPDFTGGRNYAFVGRADESADLGVVNLALPPSGTDISDVFTDYSVKQVLEDEIASVISLDQSTIDCILQDAESPAYFNKDGFIDAGVDNKPASFDADFVNLSGMNPFVPVEVRDLSVGFIQ